MRLDRAFPRLLNTGLICILYIHILYLYFCIWLGWVIFRENTQPNVFLVCILNLKIFSVWKVRLDRAFPKLLNTGLIERGSNFS